MITITLRRIMECEPCYDPIENGIFPEDWDLDAPISFQWLSDKIPHDDVIWCFSNLPDEHDGLKRHFAVDCAERVKHLMTDERSLNALVVARKHALGEASDEELRAAAITAWTARDATCSAARAARDARAATAASSAARDAAWAASSAARAARDAARDARVAARAASSAARDARAAEQQWQIRRIIELTEAGEWSPVGGKE